MPKITYIYFTIVLLLLGQASFGTTLNHPYPAGWNLVTVPLSPSDPSPSAVFDEVDPLNVYDYFNGQTVAVGEAGMQDVAPGHAYWLLLPAATSIQATGNLKSTSADYHLMLTAGWNAVGSPWPVGMKWADSAIAVSKNGVTVSLSQAITNGWVEGELRQYESPEGPYTTIVANSNPNGALSPWRGYVLYSNFSVDLIFKALPPNTVPPIVRIDSPAESSRVATLSDIVGTADDTDLVQWTLEYAAADSQQFTTLATGDYPVSSGVMSRLDPTLLLNGIGLLRLTATDLMGNTSEVERTVFIEGDNKLGNFRISFTDLEVPLSGIPITIRRTYDSRTRAQSKDFGFGWTVEVLTAGRYVNNRAPGDGWNFTSGALGIPCQGVQETKSHVTEIRFSDREFYRFAFVAHLGAPITGGCQATGSFAQIGGIPGASLQDLSGSIANRLFWETGTDQILDTDTSDTFVPTNVRLTTINGRKFDLNLQNGLYRIADLNNNVVSISSSGVSHSSGKSIGFIRDGFGRITSIVDPMNQSIVYTYDASGNLTSVTNRSIDTVGFGYDENHFLTSITDGDGKTPLTAVYDAHGRVIQLLDADGNPSSLSHDVFAGTTSTTNRQGYTTLFQYGNDGFLSDATAPGGLTSHFTYNERGKPLTETDPLGHTTSYVYDANDDLLTRTDSLNHMTTYTYNNLGQVLTTTDARGKTTTNEYDAAGNLLSVTDPLNHKTSFTYDARGNMLTETDANNCMVTNTYDASGNMLSTVDGTGAKREFTYNAAQNRLTETLHRTVNGSRVSETTIYVYDGSGRLIQQTDPLGNVTLTTFDHNGHQKTQTDARHNVTSYEYDSRGNLVNTTFADGSFEAYAYDLEGRRTASTDRNGHTSFTEYDALGRLKRNIHPDGTFTSNTYDDAGRLTATMNERGYSTLYEYDDAGRRTKITDALGRLSRFTYDENGNQLATIDAASHTTSNTYDENNRLVKTTFADGSYKTLAYDAVGRRVAETDQAGKTTQFTYDCAGRLLKVTNSMGHDTTYGYDEAGNQIRQTDANDHTTRFDYDANGRRLKRMLPLGMFETMIYDAVGNLVSKTDFNGATISYTYDSNNRLMRKDYPDGSNVLVEYMPGGQRDEVADARGGVHYSYNERNELLAVSVGNQTSLAYTYDDAGNRTSVSTPCGRTTYKFDELNRLKSATAPDNGITTYSYDEVGNRARVTYPNGTQAIYNYDQLNRLTNLNNNKSDSTVITGYTYTLGAAGNRTAVNEVSGRSVNYDYDDLYRLTRESIVGDRTISYTYDAVGNRLTKSDSSSGTTVYTYDDNDRLLTEGPNSYTYDNNGNTTGKIEPTGATFYSYDFENRLMDVTAPGKAIHYAYDIDGNRIQSVVNGAVTNYLVDTNRDYAQVLEERDNSGALIVSYVYGDDLISQNRSGVVSYYHYDGQMSTRALTDAPQQVTDTYTYDAFGNLLGSTGTTPNNYLYTGEQYDLNIGFYFLRARYFAQQNGRFLISDTFEGDAFDPQTLHKYSYALNNPVSRIDPSGHDSFVDMLGVLTIRGMIFASQHPLLMAIIGITINAVLPEDVSNSLMIAGIPEYDLGYVAKGEVRFFETIKNPSVRRFIQRRADLAGLLWNKVGHAFEDFAESTIFRGAVRQIRIGDHILDFIWRGRMIEVKTGTTLAGREIEQLAEFSSYAKESGYTLMYFFLTKPTRATINKIIKAGGTVAYMYD